MDESKVATVGSEESFRECAALILESIESALDIRPIESNKQTLAAIETTLRFYFDPSFDRNSVL